MAAYSYKPQSTVFDVCRRGMQAVYRDESPEFDNVHLGAQVHDSLMVNHPIPTVQDEWYAMARFLDRTANQHMRSTLHYKGAVDGVERDFVLGVDAKIGHNWGAMHSIKITQDYDALIEDIKRALDLSQHTVEVEPEWLATQPLIDQEQPSVFLGPQIEVS
jgi:hypothetical protein